jgi:hypothetical protein
MAIEEEAERNGGIERSMAIEKEEAAAASLQFSYDNSLSTTFSSNITASNSSNSNSTGTGKRFQVGGKTYAHKETIKQLGGKWDSQS